jgi:glycolate oxidase FAD binding subunit
VRFVATPRDLDELRTLLRQAHERRLFVLPRGCGSKLGWLDLPPIVDVLLDMGAFTKCGYDPDTASLTVGAAVTLAQAQDELTRAGRRLSLDAPSLRATLGGIAVTGETGPLAHQFGPPAAHVCDAAVVLPDGTVTGLADRATLLGAAVFDLRWAYPGWPHPVCVVCELNLQTHPLPETQCWLTMPISQPVHVTEIRDALLSGSVAPTAIELDLPGLRRGAALAGQRFATGTLSVLLEGSRPSVLDRAREIQRRLGEIEIVLCDQPPVWWGRYPFRSDEVALRLHSSDGELHLLCYAVADSAGAPVPVRGSVGSGLGWAALPGDLAPLRLISVLEAVREVLIARGGTAVVQAAPPHLRELVAPYRHP